VDAFENVFQSRNGKVPMSDVLQTGTGQSKSRISNQKRGNCECIATWGRPSHASPFRL